MSPSNLTKYRACHTTHMQPHFQCAEQQVPPSNLTKYCACHTESLACLIVVTYATSFPMRGATGVTIQPHQILRLPRKMTLQHARKMSENGWNVISNAGPIRAWSDHETVSPQPASQPRLLFEPTTSIFYCKIQRFAPNLTFQLSPSTAPATKSDTWTSPNTAPATKSDTWTSPSTAPATKSDTWTWLNTAPATKSDTWTSPSIAPATQNDSNAWSSSHMKRHLQCAEQQVSPSNLTKYCACHAKWLLCLILVTYETSFTLRGATGVTIQPHQILRLPRKMTLQDFKENLQKQVKRHFQCGADPTMIRAWSDHENANRNPPRKWGYFSRSPEALSIVKYNVSRPILHSNLHQILRLPRKVPLELHQILRLPRKVTLELHQVLHLPRQVTLELHYSTLLDSTLLDSTLLYLTLLDSTWLYLTLLDSSWL